jgi:hypothetical protein
MQAGGTLTLGGSTRQVSHLRQDGFIYGSQGDGSHGPSSIVAGHPSAQIRAEIIGAPGSIHLSLAGLINVPIYQANPNDLQIHGDANTATVNSPITVVEGTVTLTGQLHISSSMSIVAGSNGVTVNFQLDPNGSHSGSINVENAASGVTINNDNVLTSATSLTLNLGSTVTLGGSGACNVQILQYYSSQLTLDGARNFGGRITWDDPDGDPQKVVLASGTTTGSVLDAINPKARGTLTVNNNLEWSGSILCVTGSITVLLQNAAAKLSASVDISNAGRIDVSGGIVTSEVFMQNANSGTTSGSIFSVLGSHVTAPASFSGVSSVVGYINNIMADAGAVIDAGVSIPSNFQLTGLGCTFGRNAGASHLILTVMGQVVIRVAGSSPASISFDSVDLNVGSISYDTAPVTINTPRLDVRADLGTQITIGVSFTVAGTPTNPAAGAFGAPNVGTGSFTVCVTATDQGTRPIVQMVNNARIVSNSGYFQWIEQPNNADSSNLMFSVADSSAPKIILAQGHYDFINMNAGTNSFTVQFAVCFDDSGIADNDPATSQPPRPA